MPPKDPEDYALSSPPKTTPKEKKPKRENLERVSFLVDKSGRPVVDRLHDESRGKLKAILNDNTLRAELNVAPVTADAGDLIPGPMIDGLIVGLGNLECMLLARMTKAPRQLIDRIVPYTVEEQNAIRPSLSAVVNKYGGPALSKYGDEATLAVVLVTLTIKKLETIAAEMQKAPRPVPITPIADDGPIRLVPDYPTNGAESHEPPAADL